MPLYLSMQYGDEALSVTSAQIKTSAAVNETANSYCQQQRSSWLGFICAAVAVFFLGICFVPLKEIALGDGRTYCYRKAGREF